MNIVTIAIGSRHYGEMAANLAISLKCSFPEAELTCITDGKRPAGFDHYIETGETNAFRLKTRIYNVVKDKEVLFIDADTIVNNPGALRAFLEQVRETDFFMPEYPAGWGDVSDFAAHYGFYREFLNYNSSLIYWKRGKDIAKFWKEAEKCYDNPPKLSELIRGHVPDEVAFGAASALVGMYPVKRLSPIWFKWTKEDFRTFPLISLAGANMPNVVINRYNALARNAGQATGLMTYKIDNTYKRG